jgi:hypothetical protein
MQTADESPKPLAGGSFEDRAKARKELVEKLKSQWSLLWNERYNDKVRAEGVSSTDYASLRVERGTIVHATRDYKALSFREILEQNLAEDAERFIQPDAQEGGWGKFVKTKIAVQRVRREMDNAQSTAKKRGVLQSKKGGRGWLHAV